jgi:hypothetical protein
MLWNTAGFYMRTQFNRTLKFSKAVSNYPKFFNMFLPEDHPEPMIPAETVQNPKKGNL